MVATKSEAKNRNTGKEQECPICVAKPQFNAKTMAAIREGEAMLRGEIPAKWYSSIEEAREDLGI